MKFSSLTLNFLTNILGPFLIPRCYRRSSDLEVDLADPAVTSKPEVMHFPRPPPLSEMIVYFFPQRRNPG